MRDAAFVVLNGDTPSPKALSLLARALSTPAVVTENGGFLIKSWFDGQRFHFGILPNFLNGQRCYHYDIKILPSEFNLVGSVNTNHTLTALFKLDPAKIGRPLAEPDWEEFRRQYAELARFLLECGLPASFPLDAITICLFQEAKLSEEVLPTLTHLSAWHQ